MRKHDDAGPLFQWTPPICKVIAFPMVKRVGKVRRTVEVLNDRTGKGADQYWKQVVAGVRSQMTAAGLPEQIIEIELRAFADAVFRRLDGKGNRTGGDAA